ncbi:transketolase [Thermosipho ferrireducens]|uniref:Transketolase n=1 Tax=Thermosipho ferrireducens TaxID=2571116 RepID=A0ABX7S8Z0_9BACT|nr:transketolase [Thermosipho ferrireducens]QTA37620.1 transketolase [Thermosipho ferrireducens]
MLDFKRLENLSLQCRGDILKMTHVANSGHPGGSMSSIDILVTLYSFANVDSKDPWKENRDRIIISHGHISPGVYSTLAAYGFVDRDEVISGFRHPASIFEGHITRGIPGVEWTTGNLGQGLSAGVGMALAGKLKNSSYHVYVVMSDGESAKGQVAEARRTARKYNLDNLTVIIDYNDIQISGHAKDIMYVDLKSEYESAGWKVIEIDGHDHKQIYSALNIAKNDGAPTVIIAHTIIGKGVSFMEDKPDYHGKPLNAEELEKALKELGIENDTRKYIEIREKLPIKEHENVKKSYKVSINTGKYRIYNDKTDNRSALGRAIADLAVINDNVVAIDCDLKGSVKLNYLDKERPDRLIEIGVQEHNAATLAGALSVEDFVTFFADFGVFGVDETFNQHRLNAINNTNLKVVVTHCGIDVGEDGKTHHGLNYLSAPTAWFGFKVIVPADPNQTDRAVRYVAKEYGNFVIAMGRSKMEPIKKEDGSLFFDGNYSFTYGKMDVIRDGKEVAIFTMGSVVPHALNAVEELRKEGVDVALINVSCPLELDEEILTRYGREKILVVEDHNTFNGLGKLIAAKLFEMKVLPDKFQKIGLDHFPVSGSYKYLFKIYGLDSEGIKKAVKRLLED